MTKKYLLKVLIYFFYIVLIKKNKSCFNPLAELIYVDRYE